MTDYDRRPGDIVNGLYRVTGCRACDESPALCVEHAAEVGPGFGPTPDHERYAWPMILRHSAQWRLERLVATGAHQHRPNAEGTACVGCDLVAEPVSPEELEAAWDEAETRPSNWDWTSAPPTFRRTGIDQYQAESR